ncbi:MAG: rRNA maturation RNase YbeY [Candidatus Krumholzibacteriota bacterium]|nr:rRNA maturation RNase YbeY [Candidatus Krumholzibacteriota bacterium]
MKTVISSHPRAKGKNRFEKAAGEIKAVSSLFRPVGKCVGINLIGEKRMARFNRDYKGRKGAAEILTFVYPPDDSLISSEEEVSAEIFLCWKRLERGARARKVPQKAYLLRLVVHGLCHIAGYTHDSREDGLRMEKEEMKYLGKVLPSEVVARLFD